MPPADSGVIDPQRYGLIPANDAIETHGKIDPKSGASRSMGRNVVTTSDGL
jgi:hypothetical protein